MINNCILAVRKDWKLFINYLHNWIYCGNNVTKKKTITVDDAYQKKQRSNIIAHVVCHVCETNNSNRACFVSRKHLNVVGRAVTQCFPAKNNGSPRMLPPHMMIPWHAPAHIKIYDPFASHVNTRGGCYILLFHCVVGLIVICMYNPILLRLIQYFIWSVIVEKHKVGSADSQQSGGFKNFGTVVFDNISVFNRHCAISAISHT